MNNKTIFIVFLIIAALIALYVWKGGGSSALAGIGEGEGGGSGDEDTEARTTGDVSNPIILTDHFANSSVSLDAIVSTEMALQADAAYQSYLSSYLGQTVTEVKTSQGVTYIQGTYTPATTILPSGEEVQTGLNLVLPDYGVLKSGSGIAYNLTNKYLTKTPSNTSVIAAPIVPIYPLATPEQTAAQQASIATWSTDWQNWYTGLGV